MRSDFRSASCPDEGIYRWTQLTRNVFLGASLLCLGLPEAEALEALVPLSVAAHMDDGLSQVRAGRGGGGMRRGGGECIAGAAACTAAAGECIAAAGRIAAAAPTVAARTEVAPIAAAPTRRLSRRRLSWRGLSWRGVPWRRLSCGWGLSLWRLDSSRRVRLAAWRRHCGRRGDRLRQRGGCGVVGRQQLPGPACAGTIPTRAVGRASGTPASRQFAFDLISLEDRPPIRCEGGHFVRRCRSLPNPAR